MRAVLDAPERRIAVPVLQAGAVEDRLEAGAVLEGNRLRAAHPAAAAAPAFAPACRRLTGAAADRLAAVLLGAEAPATSVIAATLEIRTVLDD